ncbi:MAG: mechanosensitive ion channel [Candidatus Spechtbacteria bacterium]|nr:mechanosensitive ion channel [Candidatus Spechtbacteria bacterium]
MKKIILRTLLALGIAAGITITFVFVDGSVSWAIGVFYKGKSVLPHVITIFLLLVFGPRVWRKILDRAIHKIKIPREDESFTQRLETIRRLLLPIGNGAIFLIVFMIALDIFSIDIRPLLAGMGIIGLALGFGTKNIIEDFGSGIFILMENQYIVLQTAPFLLSSKRRFFVEW